MVFRRQFILETQNLLALFPCLQGDITTGWGFGKRMPVPEFSSNQKAVFIFSGR